MQRDLALALVLLVGCKAQLHESAAGAAVADASTPGNDAAVAPIDGSPDARPCAGGDARASDGTNCFVYVAKPARWLDAKAACEAMTAKLATITTAAQNALIGTLIGTAADPASTVFLGGSDAATEGTWLWLDNTQFWLGGAGGTAKQMYTNWGTNQPNNGNGQYQEDCLVMRGDSADKWFDRPCDAEANAPPGSYGYVCEF